MLSYCSKFSWAFGNIAIELTNVDSFPTKIYEGNRLASLISRNESSTKRTKHIDMIRHHMKELNNLRETCIIDISTDDQFADISTKPLSREKHEHSMSYTFWKM